MVRQAHHERIKIQIPLILSLSKDKGHGNMTGAPTVKYCTNVGEVP